MTVSKIVEVLGTFTEPERPAALTDGVIEDAEVLAECDDAEPERPAALTDILAEFDELERPAALFFDAEDVPGCGSVPLIKPERPAAGCTGEPC